ncbi:MAG: DUF4296 domain-containing protein [Bacteroidales bacterium]|nr:DUF4296 domain-containing protein [Bacteroidales bacterium]
MRIYIYILIPLFLFVSSCLKNSKKFIIPKEDLTTILVEMHKVDGLLNVYKVRREYNDYNKTEIYNEIIEKKGYTREQFDSTVYYYSKFKTNEFEKIFENVIDELNRIENQELIKPSIISPKDNLWNQRSEFTIAKGRNKNKIAFTIPVHGEGMYTIKAKIKLYTDDESVNPRIRAYFWHADSTKEGFRDYYELSLNKNDYFTTYMVSRRVPNNKVTHLKGWLLYHDDQETRDWSKHAEVKDIEVKYTLLRKPEQKTE